MSKNIYHFFVEGEGERAIINTLKTDFQCIQAGKVDVFNVGLTSNLVTLL